MATPAHGQSIASRAERRHEGRGDGYAGDDIALALSRECQNACSTATKRDQHVVERGRGTGEKLGLRLVQGRQQEIDCSREYTDDGGDKIVLGRPLEQFQIADAHGEAHADDGAHER